MGKQNTYLPPDTPRGGRHRAQAMCRFFFIKDVNRLLVQLRILEIRVTMFSGDIAIVINKNDTDAEEAYYARMQTAIDTVYDWRCAHGHVTSKEKCCYLMFGEDAKTVSASSEIELKIGGQRLKKAIGVKYLGLYFNRHLDGSSHSKYVADRIRKKTIWLYLLRGNRWGASVKSNMMLYHALVLSVATYAVSIYLDWLYPMELSSIQTAINVVLRAAICAPVTTRLEVSWVETGVSSPHDLSSKEQVELFPRSNIYDNASIKKDISK